MIRDVVESVGRTVLDTVGRASARVQRRTPLPVDLLESDEAFLAVFDAPGATASDVQVRFEDDVIQVRIDRFREFYEDFEMRFPGRGLALDGRVALPEGANVDPEAAEATLAGNGTLQVRVPKVPDEGDLPVEIDTSEDDAGAGNGAGDGATGSADGAVDVTDGADEEAGRREGDAGDGDGAEDHGAGERDDLGGA